MDRLFLKPPRGANATDQELQRKHQAKKRKKKGKRQTTSKNGKRSKNIRQWRPPQGQIRGREAAMDGISGGGGESSGEVGKFWRFERREVVVTGHLRGLQRCALDHLGRPIMGTGG
ncbi:hypothetical protein E2562_000726 [Oryza meyeriana var. granulata]|uniref:Uncharacterized protein n=1 Tax=Oryza meyeriana var. granulata TaxID=110450 RepID=A0A6G1DUB9_9ORYZ|nr:hypothetical protein E2562_000726 [Oryza meyeriana var. granulata]